MNQPFALICLLVTRVLGSAALAPSKTLQKRAVCTPSSYRNTSEDDTPSIAAAIKSCGQGGTILIPSGTTYSIRSTLNFTGCSECKLHLEGKLKVSNDYKYWSNYKAVIMISSVHGAAITSTTGSGVIDGNSQGAYDAFAANSSLSRPTLVYITGSLNITMSGFKQCRVCQLDNDSFINAPKNTDGFDISASTYTTIRDVYVSNQDDCIAFKPGTKYATVDAVTCAGTTHGVSVGSLGQSGNSIVKNVHGACLTASGGSKAVGIKLYASGPKYGTATVSNVTYQGVAVEDCDYGLQIQSCYNGNTTYCAEYPSIASLTDVYFNGLTGTTSGKYGSVVANLDCSAAMTCDVYVEDFSVKATLWRSSGIVCQL